MIGGYLSFAGIDGRARYGSSPLAPVLPVRTLDYDDRVEVPEGFSVELKDATHPALEGAGGEWPPLLGYNRLLTRSGPLAAIALVVVVATLVNCFYGPHRLPRDADRPRARLRPGRRTAR